jgi:O-succinylbenzoic acid--CoA ligase
VTARLLLPASARWHAAQRPDDPALIEGAVRWSWAQLDARADGIAASLRAAGVAPGERIGLLGGTSAATVAFLHGAGRAGAVVVPLGERLAAPEIAAFLDDVGVARVVATDQLLAAVRRFRTDLIPLTALLADRAPSDPRSADHWVGPQIDPASPAVIVATSGTTGRPKGALLTHGALAASAAAWLAVLPPASGWLAALSLAHVAGLGIAWRAAAAGVPVVVPSGTSPAELLEALALPPVSHVSLVAVQLARLLDSAAAMPPPPGLRAALIGGGPVPPSLVSRALAAGWPVVPTYGMTETASGVTALPTADAAGHPGSAGRALPGLELRIARPGPDGIGEIEVRGPVLFAGYVGWPAATEAALTPDGWYRTGDLGTLDPDGYLAVADRRLDLIVSGGENVYPAEVEAVLVSHPAIADAGVAALPDPTWGAVPIAAVALRAGHSVSDRELRAFCRARLAAYKVPAAFVRVQAVPRASSGKLRRDALRTMLLARVPDELVAADSRPALPALLHLPRPDGVRLAYRRLGGAAGEGHLSSRAPIVLLHATLSSGAQLARLAALLARHATVLLPDRRGSGASRLAAPRSVPIPEQVADLLALLDQEGAARACLVGHSFGGVVALAAAALAAERVAAVIAYEPPYLTLLEEVGPRLVAELGTGVAAAYAMGGAPAAAEYFLRTISPESWAAMPDRQRSAVLAEGESVLADAAFAGIEAIDLARIVAPVTLATGGASEPYYVPIADALATRIRGARRVHLPGLRHVAPITDPHPVADLVLHAL